MRVFNPSAAFVAFFNQVIAAAEAPVTAGSYMPVIPTFTDQEEDSFVQVHLVPLIRQVDTMRRSVSPAPAPNPYALDPSTGQPLHPEAWGVTGGGV